MNALIQTLTGIFSLTSMGTQNQDDQYLAESTDIYDLERRMRQIEAGTRAGVIDRRIPGR